MKELQAPCGIDCSVCDAYKATQQNDLEMIKKMAENYKAKFNKDIPIESLYCDGCMSDGRHIGFCGVCEIRSCSADKGYNTCAECSELPCEKGKFIWTDGSKSLEKLQSLR